MMEYEPSKFISYIALGNRFNMGPVTLELDLMNRAASHQTYFFKDCSVMANLIYGVIPMLNIYGKVTKVCSSRDVDDPRYQRTLTEDNCEVKPGTLAGDGSLERPFIVFFGESVPMISVAAEAAEQADIFVIIGTSLNVYPAAGLIHYVRPSVPVYLIDPEPSMGVGRQNFKHFQCGASEGMKLLCEELC